MDFGVTPYPAMPSRPCAFCLRLQGGSVFADFDVDPSGRAYIVRISYDGFGCCEPAIPTDLVRMSAEDTQRLLSAVEEGEMESPAVLEVLSAYFNENRDSLWPHALLEHGLIAGEPG